MRSSRFRQFWSRDLQQSNRKTGKISCWLWLTFLSSCFLFFNSSWLFKGASSAKAALNERRFPARLRRGRIKYSNFTAATKGLRGSSGSVSEPVENNTGKANNMMMPAIMYGTAWKKERTTQLVEMAVRRGFRGIDTACQPKHYYEPGVGEALSSLYDSGVVKREDLFIQTKFTPIRGQDPNNVPYDPSDPLPQQVLQSFQVSCQNLKTDYLDSLVLHSPLNSLQDTLVVWRTFEDIHRSGGAKQLGLSNTYDIETLRAVYEAAVVKPTVLQNRFYSDSDYDVEVRRFCLENGIRYQSFWTLTANPHILRSPLVQSLARKYEKTPQQIFFAFVRSQGITPLTGTSSEEHMAQDLEAVSIFVLLEEEANSIAALL